MVYKIADFNIEINSVYPNIHDFCADYLCKENTNVDFSITTTYDDIKFELDNGRKNGATGVCTKTYLEELAVYRKICSSVLQYDAFLMHGALIEHDGKGYLFTAKSGTGKTTHINLWKELFGDDKVTIVNGDKPIIRFIDGKAYAYGTPWCGKEGYNVNTRVELCAIIFLERAVDNSILKISSDVALPRILSQIMLTDSPNLGKQLELIDRLFSSVNTYLLKCNMDIEAARVAYAGMSSDEGRE